MNRCYFSEATASPLVEAPPSLNGNSKVPWPCKAAFFHEESARPQWLRLRWLYLRCLALLFIATFWSLAQDIEGLIGPKGLMPAAGYLAQIAQISGPIEKLFRAPTLLWLGSGALALKLLCWGGLLAAILLLFNLWPRLNVFLCWLCFLSFVSVGSTFSEWQSDEFLLENALLAVFLAPRGIKPGLGRESPPSPLVIALFWWLSFRLMFESGLGKLVSYDDSWRRLDVESFHEGCPFPSLIGWYLHQAPHAFHVFEAAFALLVEVAVPWMIWLGRWPRAVAAILWMALQTAIALSGSFTTINYGAMTTALLLFDDSVATVLLGRLSEEPVQIKHPRRRLELAVLSFIFYVTAVKFVIMLGQGWPLKVLPQLALYPLELAGPFHSANQYQVYIAINRMHGIIEFQGSDDGGRTWKAYPFKRQPQKLEGPLGYDAPFMARLDWHLFYAAFGRYQDCPLVVMAAKHLLEGEPSVLRLFAGNPFPDKPPQMIRLAFYRYRFTDFKTRRDTGQYWRRKLLRFYAPILTLDKEGKLKFSA